MADSGGDCRYQKRADVTFAHSATSHLSTLNSISTGLKDVDDVDREQ